MFSKMFFKKLIKYGTNQIVTHMCDMTVWHVCKVRHGSQPVTPKQKRHSTLSDFFL